MIYAVLFFSDFESLFIIASAVIVLAWHTVTLTEKEESQKIDDFPFLVTSRSITSVMLSSKVNSPVAHGST